MGWKPIPITGGCVTTRNPEALELGELISASRCRLVPGDTIQLHQDAGGATIYETTLSLQTPLRLRLLQFENILDKLLVVSYDAEADATVLTVMDQADPNTVWLLQSFSGLLTSFDVVLFGNEYYFISNAGNYIIFEDTSQPSELSITPLGLSSSSDNVTALRRDQVSYTTNPPGAVWEQESSASPALVLWFITEYDEDRDVESKPVYYIVTGYSEDWSVSQPEYVGINGDINNGVFFLPNNASFALYWDQLGSPANSRTTHWKLYRHYLGTDAYRLYRASAEDQYSASWEGGKEFVERTALPVGGLLEIVSTDSSDTFLDLASVTDDPAPTYELIDYRTVGGLAAYDLHEQPEAMNAAVMFEEALVGIATANPREILYSPIGLPEYQPDPYRRILWSESSDIAVGLEQMRGYLFVLTEGGILRYNYLEYESTTTTERNQYVVARRHAPVGKRAFTTSETPQGEMLVWLSNSGQLSWSYGEGWADACPDWNTNAFDSGATLSECVLVNNAKYNRLELYEPHATYTNRWDFYYHETLLKYGSKLRMMGPTRLGGKVVDAISGWDETEGQYRVWTLRQGTNKWYITAECQEAVYPPNAQFKLGELNAGQLTTRERLYGNPFRRIDIGRLGFQHNYTTGLEYEIADTVYERTRFGKTVGFTVKGDAGDGMHSSFVYTQGDAALNGHAHRFTVTVTAGDGWSLGPLWLNMDIPDAGDD